MAPEAAGKNEYGAKNGNIASHRWLGGNTAVPFYYGDAEQLRKTIDFLKNQNLSVDIFALRNPTAHETVAPLGVVPASLQTGETAQALVVIQNKGLGHSLIPEQRDFYEAWVEFTVTDADGREVSHSGYLKADGTLDEQAHSFTNRLVGADGRGLALHEIWLRRAVAFDNTILPGHSSLVRYEFHVPENAKGPLTITARLNYRHFTQQYLDYTLGADHAPYPIVEMASQSREILLANQEASQAALQPHAAASSVQPPEWLRWNNFGCRPGRSGSVPRRS